MKTIHMSGETINEDSQSDPVTELKTQKHKKVTPRKTKQTQFNDSNTGVYPLRTHGKGIWGNRRVVFSVRMDEKLKKASKPVLIAIYGSTCRGIESFLAGLVATYEQQGISGVYPGHTSIGKIVIERNLRPRRKLEVEEVTDVQKTVKKTRRVVTEVPDYSNYSTEELNRLHKLYWNLGKVGKSALVVAELKRRGAIQ